MNKINKGFAPIIIALIIAGVLGGGYGVNKYLAKPTLPTKDGKDIQKRVTGQETTDWKTYTNSKIGYSISYPSSYHLAYGNDLLNYDEKIFERGNQEGVKIQIQQANAFLFDVDVELGRQKFIDSLNGSTNGEAQETPIVPFILNVIKYKNTVLGGPGGSFDVYYAFPDNLRHVSTGPSGSRYFKILVWGSKNDEETIREILATFKFVDKVLDDTLGWITVQDYRYEIKYPTEKDLQSLKIRPEINIGPDLNACRSNESMSNTKEVLIGDSRFYFSPLQANGGEFVEVYTTVENNLCYQVLFRIGDRSSVSNSPEIKRAIDVVTKIMNTFKFVY